MEIKYQGDRIEKAQFNNYKDLKDQCAQAKKASKVTASEGFKLSLFRYPEDASPTEHKDSKSTTPSRTKKKR